MRIPEPVANVCQRSDSAQWFCRRPSIKQRMTCHSIFPKVKPMHQSENSTGNHGTAAFPVSIGRSNVARNDPGAQDALSEALDASMLQSSTTEGRYANVHITYSLPTCPLQTSCLPRQNPGSRYERCAISIISSWSSRIRCHWGIQKSGRLKSHKLRTGIST